MRTDIQWEPYLWDEPRPMEPHELEQLEHQWSVRLPADYKELVARYQGMAPEPSVFEVGRGDDAICVLLTINTGEEKESYSVHTAESLLRAHLPAGIHPFAKTIGSEYLCFDYRNAPDCPRVVLVTVEMTVHPIADSFSEFLGKLHP